MSSVAVLVVLLTLVSTAVLVASRNHGLKHGATLVRDVHVLEEDLMLEERQHEAVIGTLLIFCMYISTI